MWGPEFQGLSTSSQGQIGGSAQHPVCQRTWPRLWVLSPDDSAPSIGRADRIPCSKYRGLIFLQLESMRVMATQHHSGSGQRLGSASQQSTLEPGMAGWKEVSQQPGEAKLISPQQLCRGMSYLYNHLVLKLHHVPDLCDSLPVLRHSTVANWDL